jgi:sugar lactone lactonase YvrE
MTVDATGGVWVGMMHRGVLATRGTLFHARSVRAEPTRVASGLGVPNGMKLSADGRTLYVIDTLERTLLAYAVDGGKLSEPIIVSDFLGLPGKPDGMTLAPDGTFWVAMWGGSCVVQLASDGAFVRKVAVPAPHVSSLCFVASNRLMVTTSRMRLSPQALSDHPGSGGLFEILLELA